MEAPCFHLSLQTDLSSACAACEACRNQASCDAFKSRKEKPDDTVGLPVEYSCAALLQQHNWSRQAHESACYAFPVSSSQLSAAPEAVCKKPATDLNEWSISWPRTRAERV